MYAMYICNVFYCHIAYECLQVSVYVYVYMYIMTYQSCKLFMFPAYTRRVYQVCIQKCMHSCMYIYTYVCDDL